MAILPAHLMRSIAGKYDNEAVAMALIVSTFYFWVRSLRDDRSVLILFFWGIFESKEES